MKITILSPFLSSNGAGRAYLLAKILERRYPVEVIGPVAGDGLWKPLAGEKFCYTGVNVQPGLGSLKMLRALLDKARGDVLYASKPLLTSFGVGLLKKYSSGKPLVLDADDWELGGYLSLPLSQRVKLALHPVAARLDAFYPTIPLLHRLAPLADAHTVSSRTLQKLYGGVIIPHGRDTARFDPSLYESESIKKERGLQGTTVMFLGTPRRRKGLEDLLEAVRIMKRSGVQVAVVGANPEAGFTKELKSQGDDFLKLYGEQPFQKVPAFLSSADVVVVPQRAEDAFSQAQIPAKLIDAMAMARPIVATDVSDIPEILSDGCGKVVPPGNPAKLAEALEWCLDHPSDAADMGARARLKCIKMYSWDALEPVLASVFAPFE